MLENQKYWKSVIEYINDKNIGYIYSTKQPERVKYRNHSIIFTEDRIVPISTLRKHSPFLEWYGIVKKLKIDRTNYQIIKHIDDPSIFIFEDDWKIFSRYINSKSIGSIISRKTWNELDNFISPMIYMGFCRSLSYMNFLKSKEKDKFIIICHFPPEFTHFNFVDLNRHETWEKWFLTPNDRFERYLNLIFTNTNPIAKSIRRFLENEKSLLLNLL